MASTKVQTTMSPADQLFAYFKSPVLVIRFYQIGYAITFLLGFFGNISSLMTFSRPSLRKVSTGCLFITLAISDLLYLLICVIDVLEFGIQVMKKSFSTIENIFLEHRFLSIIVFHTMNFVDFVCLSPILLKYHQHGY